MQFILFHDVYPTALHTAEIRSLAAYLLEFSRLHDVFTLVDKMVDFVSISDRLGETHRSWHGQVNDAIVSDAFKPLADAECAIVCSKSHAGNAELRWGWDRLPCYGTRRSFLDMAILMRMDLMADHKVYSKLWRANHCYCPTSGIGQVRWWCP